MSYPQGNPHQQPSGGPPPRQRDPRVVVAVVLVAVAALAGVAVLGFVTPGFFLGGGSSNASGGGSTPSRHNSTSTTEPAPVTTTGQPGPEVGRKKIEAFVTAINNHDEAGAKALACPPSTIDYDISAAVKDPEGPGVVLAPESAATTTDTTYDIPYQAVRGHKLETGKILGSRYDTAISDWCIGNFSY